MTRYYIKKILQYIVIALFGGFILFVLFKPRIEKIIGKTKEGSAGYMEEYTISADGANTSVTVEEKDPTIIEGMEYAHYTKIKGLMPKEYGEDDGYYRGHEYTVTKEYGDTPAYLVFFYTANTDPGFCAIASEDMTEFYLPVEDLGDIEPIGEIVFAPGKLHEGDKYYFLTKNKGTFGKCFMYDISVEDYRAVHTPDIDNPREP